MDSNSTCDRRLPANLILVVVLCMASLAASAAGTDPYIEERPQLAALLGAGILVVLLVTAGLLLVVRGLRADLRDRKRGYRRRGRRAAGRAERPPVAPRG